MSEQQSPDETEVTPHRYVECTNAHLLPRSPHCWICDRGPDDEIHQEAA